MHADNRRVTQSYKTLDTPSIYNQFKPNLMHTYVFLSEVKGG